MSIRKCSKHFVAAVAIALFLPLPGSAAPKNTMVYSPIDKGVVGRVMDCIMGTTNWGYPTMTSTQNPTTKPSAPMFPVTNSYVMSGTTYYFYFRHEQLYTPSSWAISAYGNASRSSNWTWENSNLVP